MWLRYRRVRRSPSRCRKRRHRNDWPVDRENFDLRDRIAPRSIPIGRHAENHRNFDPLTEVTLTAADVLKLDVLRGIKSLKILAEVPTWRQDAHRPRIEEKGMRRRAAQRRPHAQPGRQAHLNAKGT